MNRTSINVETRQTKAMPVSGEKELAWMGALALEIVMTIVAFYAAGLIGECAGLWHDKASLGRDLNRYYGTVLSYADRTAKWFGFRKTWGNVILAVFLEILTCDFFSKCLGAGSFNTDGDDHSRVKSVLSFSAVIHFAMYVLPAIFSHSSSFYGPLQDDWEFKERYLREAAYSRTWILFWLLVCVVLALIMRAFVSQQKNQIAVTCFLIIFGLIVVGTYFNDDTKTLRDVANLVEDIGHIIFRH